MLDKERIRAALEGALPSAPSDDAPNYRLTMLLHEANAGSAKAEPRLVALLEVLRGEPDLSLFNGTMQVRPDGAVRFEHQNLASWLISRAQHAGINQALEDLSKYLSVTELPCEYTMALSGLQPEVACNLGRGISLVPWDALQESVQKRSVWERIVAAMPFWLPSGALIREVPIQKLHVRADEIEKIRAIMKPIDGTELYDALMCLSLIGPCAPHVIASWTGNPVWAPTIGGGMSMPYLEGLSQNRPFTEQDCREACQLFTAFYTLSPEVQNRLRLVMQRLSRAMRRVTSVDASIDLGIALEGLYLNDMPEDRGELTFRLKTRAARFLGTNEADRTQISRLVGDLYGLRSSAVHTGSVKDNLRGRPVQQVLGEGFSLAADTCRRFIKNGPPNWDTVMFS